MTEEQIIKNNHIPIEIITRDILDTDKEIKDLSDELDILRRNPVENKVRIFFLEGNILKLQDFIKDLNDILIYRKNYSQ